MTLSWKKNASPNKWRIPKPYPKDTNQPNQPNQPTQPTNQTNSTNQMTQISDQPLSPQPWEAATHPAVFNTFPAPFQCMWTSPCIHVLFLQQTRSPNLSGDFPWNTFITGWFGGWVTFSSLIPLSWNYPKRSWGCLAMYKNKTSLIYTYNRYQRQSHHRRRHHHHHKLWNPNKQNKTNHFAENKEVYLKSHDIFCWTLPFFWMEPVAPKQSVVWAKRQQFPNLHVPRPNVFSSGGVQFLVP